MSELRIGMVGLDTSHCPAFCDLLNLTSHPHHVQGGKVVCAYPGGSEEFSLSRNRVADFTRRVQENHGVTIVDSIEEVAAAVDAIFLESSDGRQHLEQFAKLAPFKKPVFIDKPLATSVADAKAILALARQYGTPVFSASSLRYAAGVADLGGNEAVLGCQVCGPTPILPDFPGYFWYGIHSVEMLMAKMGAGCRSVQVWQGEQADVIVGTWADGRTGTCYGYRFNRPGAFAATVITASGVHQGVAKTDPPYYAMLLPRVINFFRTGCSPVSEAETLEIIAFLEAADASRASGQPVKLADISVSS